MRQEQHLGGLLAKADDQDKDDGDHCEEKSESVCESVVGCFLPHYRNVMVNLVNLVNPRNQLGSVSNAMESR